MNTQSNSLPIPTIDCQVHAYERDRPERPWKGWLIGPEEVTGDDMVKAMDAVGVHGAILVSPHSMYRFDPGYALEVQARHPGRFALVKPFDIESPNVEEEVADWAGKPGVVGARIMLRDERPPAVDHPGVNAILDAAARHALVVNILGTGKLPYVSEIAKRHPDTQLVLDHLGLSQPFEPPAPPDPFADLPKVVALAECDNIAIKISGACTLSHEPFPYNDIWEPLGRIFDAFGFERCMWGTDWTRAVELLTYEQGVEAFRVTERLSDSQRAMLMGGSLTRIYGWSPTIG
jgi:predicted TIM-barrel fold metal-dependent hydrolase